MNHDSLKSGIFMSLMSVYNSLYHEYSNETKAKRELLKITREALAEMSLDEGLERTIIIIANKYKNESDLRKKKEYYDQLSTLDSALKIMEQTNNG